jgi:chloramphenicol 3-O-phosphotransferase
MKTQATKSNLVGIVGPCSAGKSTLIEGLKGLGYTARHIAQEHSYVPDMWQRLVNPIALVYLDVSYDISMMRRQLNMNRAEFERQKNRLSHAYQNADLNIHTDALTPDEVLDLVVKFLGEKYIEP